MTLFTNYDSVVDKINIHLDSFVFDIDHIELFEI